MRNDIKNADMPAMPILGDSDNFLLYMQEINGGRNYGLTKREHFAGLDLQGICSNPNYDPDLAVNFVNAATDALRQADELLKVLEV